MNAPTEVGYADVALRNFKKNNPHALVKVDGESIIIDKPWGRSDAKIRFQVNDHDFALELNNLVLNPRFDAVIHVDKNEIEFVYSYVDPKDKDTQVYLNRKFVFIFEGREYNCEFREPTPRLLHLANCVDRLPSDEADRTVPQLRQFKDAQRLETLPSQVKKFFEGREPRCFFVKANDGFEGINSESLIRHLNFLIRYYDRESPLIVIKEIPTGAASDEFSQLRMVDGVFPDTIVSPGKIDDVVMRLLEVAYTSSVRAAYIYYYQVFEYAGYYYIDDKTRTLLRNALRDPALISCNEDKVSELFGIFSDINQNDEVKMRKVIEDNCDPKVIWKEVVNDFDFFSSPQQFEGGFSTNALISKDTTEASWSSMWMPKTFDLLTKIRNVLVHAREKRESKVILPTAKNNEILFRYIPLISRIAEQLAIKA